MQDRTVLLAVDPGFSATSIVARALVTADKVLTKAVELLHAQGMNHAGGYLCLTSAAMAPLMAISAWGTIPEEKILQCSEVVQEKIRRLQEHPLHFTSYQSRDPGAEITVSQGRKWQWGKWGGAIFTGEYYLSFTGLPELWDEAAMFVTALQMEWMEETALLRRISRPRNPHLRPLIVAMDKVA